MSNRNASASAFGWDFQRNAALVLMLDNIKEADSVRVEGEYEDIEITFMDDQKIYSQVKSVAKPDDYSNVISKLSDAIKTLNDDANNGDGCLYTYFTNSPNPFNAKETMSYFIGRTHLLYEELPDIAKNKIDAIINKNCYKKLDISKFDIRVLPFYGVDEKNRYKHVLESINEFLGSCGISIPDMGNSIMEVWQKDFFGNATKPDTEIVISKKEMMWPLIVLVVNEAVASDYKREFDDDEISDIEHKYRKIINQKTMMYEFVTKVITDFHSSRKKIKDFVDESWGNYINEVTSIEADTDVKETLIKIILYRILAQRSYVDKIKRGTNL